MINAAKWRNYLLAGADLYCIVRKEQKAAFASRPENLPGARLAFK